MINICYFTFNILHICPKTIILVEMSLMNTTNLEEEGKSEDKCQNIVLQ